MDKLREKFLDAQGEPVEVRETDLTARELATLDFVDAFLECFKFNSKPTPPRVYVYRHWFDAVLAKHPGASGLLRQGIPLVPR